jgi:crotonobetainyl-CoA:carnitine CoA-transferase CaiB-like acyl-CoA transferase
LGNKHPNISPYELYRTKDSFIILAIGNNYQFLKLCEILGLDKNDERFISNEKRVINREYLKIKIENKLIESLSSQWLEVFNENQIPCSKINNIKEALGESQVKERNMIWELGDEIKVIGNPIHFDNIDLSLDVLQPPKLGEHTIEILKNILNYGNEKIENLKNKNII